MTPEEWLASEFQRCRPWLQAALDTSPLKSHTIDHVWEALQSGAAQLWPSANAVCLTEIRIHPTGLKAFNGWLAGGDMEEVRNTSRMLEAYAISQECDVIQIHGRRGWLRAFKGYSDAGTTMIKDLRQ